MWFMMGVKKHSRHATTVYVSANCCSLDETAIESISLAKQSRTKPVTTTVLQKFFREHPGEPVPEENFWTLWRKGRLTEADTQTIRLAATPSGLTNAHARH